MLCTITHSHSILAWVLQQHEVLPDGREMITTTTITLDENGEATEETVTEIVESEEVEVEESDEEELEDEKQKQSEAQSDQPDQQTDQQVSTITHHAQ